MARSIIVLRSGNEDESGAFLTVSLCCIGSKEYVLWSRKFDDTSFDSLEIAITEGMNELALLHRFTGLEVSVDKSVVDSVDGETARISTLLASLFVGSIF